jgi:hypothetical protein
VIKQTFSSRILGASLSLGDLVTVSCGVHCYCITQTFCHHDIIISSCCHFRSSVLHLTPTSISKNSRQEKGGDFWMNLTLLYLYRLRYWRVVIPPLRQCHPPPRPLVDPTSKNNLSIQNHELSFQGQSRRHCIEHSNTWAPRYSCGYVQVCELIFNSAVCIR